MAFNTDSMFGIQPAALQLQRRRMELIAGNIANADTPGYLARDIDFRKVLASAQQTQAQTPRRTHLEHMIQLGATAEAPAYRIQTQPAEDGNSVDTQVEQGQFADAALRYQASLSFMDARIKSLLNAITGQ